MFIPIFFSLFFGAISSITYCADSTNTALVDGHTFMQNAIMMGCKDNFDRFFEMQDLHVSIINQNGEQANQPGIALFHQCIQSLAHTQKNTQEDNVTCAVRSRDKLYRIEGNRTGLEVISMGKEKPWFSYSIGISGINRVITAIAYEGDLDDMNKTRFVLGYEDGSIGFINTASSVSNTWALGGDGAVTHIAKGPKSNTWLFAKGNNIALLKYVGDIWQEKTINPNCWKAKTWGLAGIPESITGIGMLYDGLVLIRRAIDKFQIMYPYSPAEYAQILGPNASFEETKAEYDKLVAKCAIVNTHHNATDRSSN